MPTCTKTQYRSKEAARKAALGVRRKSYDLSSFREYRCEQCRYPDGQRAWHWGHLNRGGRMQRGRRRYR